MKKKEKKFECEFAEVSYPYDNPPKENGGVGGACGNTWFFRRIEGWGKNQNEAVNDLFDKARRQSSSLKIIADCGSQDCSHEAGVCKYRAELTPSAPQRIPFYDLEAPEGTPPRLEFMIVGTLRYGCFCDYTV